MDKREFEPAVPQVKKKNKFALFLFFGLLVALVMLALSLPIFNITDVEISGNTIISSEMIKQAVNIRENQNIHTFFPSFASNEILKISYIKSAKVSKEYPSKIIIEVVERIPRAYVKVMNMESYLIVDEEGTVLEVTGFVKEKLPVIVGLKFSDFALGEILETDNKKSFESIVMLSGLYKNNDLSDSLRVEISDEKDIHLYIGGVDVIFGDIEDANEKMLTVIEVMKKLPEGTRGFLDVKSDPQKVTFKYLK